MNLIFVYVNIFPMEVVKYQLFIAVKFDYRILKVEIENHANLFVISNVP